MILDEKSLSSKMSKIVMSKVITVSKNWPSFDVPKQSVSGMTVLSNGEVVVLDREKSSMRIFQLSPGGKYTKKCQCIKGFVTKPISVCTYKLLSSNQERLAVLERTDSTGTKLFTCSTSLANKAIVLHCVLFVNQIFKCFFLKLICMDFFC